jgi:hypothetical protein
MSKETLLRMRFIVPGVILIVALLPLIQPSIDLNEFLKISLDKAGIFYIVAIFFVGGIYHISKLRNVLMGPSLAKINENISEKLLLPFEKEAGISKLAADLREGRKLLNVFYTFIDNDKVLSERAKEVYFNGLVMSSVVDLGVMSVVAALVYALAYVRGHQFWFAEIALAGIALSIASVFLLKPIVKYHIRLSNRQIEYIVDHYRKELRAELVRIGKSVGG